MAGTKADAAAAREKVLEAIRAGAGVTTEIAGRARMTRSEAFAWLRRLEEEGLVVSRKVKTARVRTGVAVWAVATAVSALEAACARVGADRSPSAFMRYAGPRPGAAGAGAPSSEASS